MNVHALFRISSLTLNAILFLLLLWLAKVINQKHFSHEGLIHKTRIKRNANDVFFMINKHPCHQFDYSEVFTHPFRTDWGQISSVGIFYSSDLSIFKVIYGICLHFEVSLWIVWWRISISFRDILPDVVESHLDSPLWEEINSQIWTKRIVLQGTKYN